VTQWIERQKQAAVLDEDESTYLDRISDWQTRAQQEAEQHSHASTKKAVRECPPTDSEAGALYQLFALRAETVYHVAREELERASEVDALELQDVLQEAYVLYQRSMVQYDPERGTLKNYLAHALRQRIKGYIQRHSATTSEDGESEVADGAAVAPGFSIPALYEELKEEGRVAAEAEELHNRITP
jgi:hypothetical protein